MIFNFYVSFNGKSGYGHLFRSMALEIELRKRGHQCYWYKKLAFTERVPDWWIIDTPKLPSSAISSVSPMLGYATKLCYLGATGNVDYDGNLGICDLIICQGAVEHQVDGRWLAGFEYALLWPGLYVTEDQERKVLVYRSVYQGMEDIATTLNDYGIPVHLTTGGSVRNDKQLCSSAVVITPWGMTSLEAMYLGIPQVAICFQKHAAHSTMEASRKGAIHLLFSDEHAWKERAINEALLLLGEFSIDGATYISMSEAGRKLIDGQGAMRVADALEGKS